MPTCLGLAQLPLRKHRLSQLFAAWQSCQGCTYSTKLFTKFRLKMLCTYLAPTVANSDHLPPGPARQPRRAGTAGQPLACGWPAGDPAARAVMTGTADRAWTELPRGGHPELPPVWQPTHFGGGKRLNSAGPGSGSGGLAPSCHPPPELHPAWPRAPPSPPPRPLCASRRRSRCRLLQANSSFSIGRCYS